MTRGEVWLAEVGRKRRPVLVLTRREVIDVRALVTVAEITTGIRGIGAEVAFDHRAIGLERESAVNCDGLHTVTQISLAHRVGELDDTTMQQVCSALNYALGC
ncbi:MAG TPA: type II toxin-antitoxin system PemK/MazF family toxin [Acidimicrobiales bacterium]|nr:type II toxin-antitoxin system PemK/MazF family toxin [Acidimicrobiales bacterium]